MFDYIDISINDFNELRRQCLHCNIYPRDILFYLNSYANENHPVRKIAIKMQENILLQIEKMGDMKFNNFVNSFPNSYKDYFSRDRANGRFNYERVSNYFIMGLLYRDLIDFKKIIKNDFYESEVFKVYPELKDFIDEDNLLTIDKKFILTDVGVEYKEHIIHYSQFFRRGFYGNPNINFISDFIKLYNESLTKNKFSISLDFNRIVKKEHYSQTLEFDTWYGLLFKHQKIDDPFEVGVTVMARNPDSLFTQDNQLIRTEILWSYKNNLKTLQIEEVDNIDHNYQGFYINRYIHSIRDINKKIFSHLDGAVKIYFENIYKQRFNSRIDSCVKSDKYIKLFRIDGDIKFQKWMDIICSFYKENEMIIEYFDPIEFENLFELRMRDFKKWRETQDI